MLDTTHGDENTGVKIILKALEEPLIQIVNNAGLEGVVIVNNLKSSKIGTGFDIMEEQYVDMISAGIVDPAKVTRSALQNAASVASLLITTEAAVVDAEEEAPMPQGDPMGGGMY